VLYKFMSIQCLRARLRGGRVPAPPARRPSWVPSLQKKPWTTVFFFRSAPALIGGSETLPPHIRLFSATWDIEAFFAVTLFLTFTPSIEGKPSQQI